MFCHDGILINEYNKIIKTLLDGKKLHLYIPQGAESSTLTMSIDIIQVAFSNAISLNISSTFAGFTS